MHMKIITRREVLIIMGKAKVLITNDQTEIKIPVGIRLLVRRCCHAVAVSEKFERDFEVSVSFVDDKRIIKGVATIVTDTPYARKVYFDPEITIHQEKNPNAKQYWFDDYIEGEKKNLPIKYYAQMLKRRQK